MVTLIVGGTDDFAPDQTGLFPEQRKLRGFRRRQWENPGKCETGKSDPNLFRIFEDALAYLVELCRANPEDEPERIAKPNPRYTAYCRIDWLLIL